MLRLAIAAEQFVSVKLADHDGTAVQELIATWLHDPET
jgi:hypothetical protein